jgi:hypothetical protein
MTRLKNYIISENSEIDDENWEFLESLIDTQVSKIKKECSQYLKLLSGREALYRGIKNLPYDIYFGKKPVRKDRKPRGQMKEASKFTNDWLKSKGWPRRDESIMAISTDYDAKRFGTVVQIFPIGKFNYAWLNGYDFNSFGIEGKEWNIEELHSLVNTKKDYDRAKQYLEDYITGNKGFDIAHQLGYEIWMNPKAYYWLHEQRLGSEIMEMGNFNRDQAKKIINDKFGSVGIKAS